jgi:hypothetical protein
MAGVYAERLAQRGFVTLAFDFRHWGASEGQTRQLDSPARKIRDIANAVALEQREVMTIMRDLTDTVGLITGGSRGIGRAVALALAEAGADIAVNYHSRENEAEQVCSQVERHRRRCLTVRATVPVAGGKPIHLTSGGLEGRCLMTGRRTTQQ